MGDPVMGDPVFGQPESYLPELAEFVAIPSVSRESGPRHMRAAAQWLAGQIAFAGGRILPADGNPVVAGEWNGAPGAPTVLVYGHYDVQPTGSPAEWRTPPFELTVAGGKAYGRGATDDKGPILVVLKTAQAFMEQFGALPLNVKFPFDDAAYAAELGVPVLHGEPGYSTLERLWMRPTLEINGITGGGPYTVIPHVASAHVTCRLVPGQRPAGVLEAISAHLGRVAAPGVRVEITAEKGGAAAYTIDPRHPAVAAARAALAAVYPGQEVILARIGGTLPGTVLFEEVLDAKTLFFSFSIADEMLHAPNEYLRVRRLGEGMRAWSHLWRLLGEQRPGAMSASAWP